MWSRTISLGAAFTVMGALEYSFSLQWYWTIPLGALTYVVGLYVGYFINERRYINRMMRDAMRNRNN